jgi:hypothetical protein
LPNFRELGRRDVEVTADVDIADPGLGEVSDEAGARLRLELALPESPQFDCQLP